MEIKTHDYHIQYNTRTGVISCAGILRLTGIEEYKIILDFLKKAAQESGLKVTLDMEQLTFLNSSGINMLSRFIICLRQKKEVHVIIKGSLKILWQSKSLKNLQRLMPSLQLEWL